MCIQEWYVPHNRQVSDNKDDESDDDDRYHNFENERKNDARYLSVALDMTAFQRYEKIETNTKLSPTHDVTHVS